MRRPTAVDEAFKELLGTFADLLEQGGREAFVAGPLIVHNTSHFPDPWAADLIGVRTAIRRMLVHASLPQLHVEVRDERGHPSDEVEAGVHLVDYSAREAVFAVTSLPSPKYLVASIALEVARLWSGLTTTDPRESPYRRSEEEPPELVDDVSASLAMFALGFGVLAVNGSATMLKSETLTGGYAVGKWQQLQVVALPPVLCESLLAVQLVLRDFEADALEATMAEIQSDHVHGVRQQLKTLLPHAAELRQSLRLPPRQTWPQAWAPDIEPLLEDRVNETLRAAELARREGAKAPNRGQPVFRVRPRNTIRGAALGLLAAIAALLTLPGDLKVVAAGFLFAGIAWGRWTRGSLCSDSECERRLSTRDETCPGCGGTIVGELSHRNERLDALEELERRSRPP